MQNGVGEILIVKNEILLNSGLSPLYNLTNLSLGSYNISAVYLGNENYTTDNETWKVVILEYETNAPIVELVSPSNGASNTAGTITFSYNVSDVNDLTNCSLIINNVSTVSSNVISRNITQTLARAMSVGSYDWNVNCTDIFGNHGSSNVSRITITAVQQQNNDNNGGGSSGGRGGGGTIALETLFISQQEISLGSNFSVYTSQKVIFSSEVENHSFIVNNFNENFANITIRSKERNVVLTKKQTVSLDIDKDLEQDIYLTYNGLVNFRPSFYIRSLQSSTDLTKSNSGKITGETIGGKIKTFQHETNLATILLLVVWLLIMIFLILFGCVRLRIFLRHKHIHI